MQVKIKRFRLFGVGLLLTVVAFTGCGRMPPPEHWQPSAQDSTAIDSIVLANKDLLTVNFAEAEMQYLEWVVPDTILKKAIKDNPFKQRYICDSARHILVDSLRKWHYRFVATVDTGVGDTTATVFVTETIPGKLVMHARGYTRYLRDSIIITPSDTIRLPFYDTIWTDTSLIVEKPINAIAYDGCVLRKEQGTWRFWKLAGGQRFYAPTFEDAPFLLNVYLTNGVRSDTFTWRPDTLHFGTQRFYDYPDGLLTYQENDSLWITSFYNPTGTDFFNFFHFQGIRYRVIATNRIRLTQPGVHRLYVEQMPYGVFYDSGGELNATIWGIPIYVKGGGQ